MASKVKDTVEKEAEAIINMVKVELKEVTEGLHTIFTSKGRVSFENGVAEVDSKVADELKDAGLTK